MQSPEWEIGRAAWEAIVKRHPGATAKDFDPKEFVVVAVWTVTGIVGNGGFEYLFENTLPGDPEYKLALQAFQTIACGGAALAFERALASLESIPGDWKTKRDHFSELPEDVRDGLNDMFWNSERQIDVGLAEYVKRELPDDMPTQ